jgi:hypothetical protein
MIDLKNFVFLLILFHYEKGKLEKDDQKLVERKKKYINIGKIGKL